MTDVLDHMTTITRSALAALACALAVGACGSSSSTTSHATAAPATATSTASSGSATAASGGASATGSVTDARSTLDISAATSGALMFSMKTMTTKAGKVTINFTNKSPEGHDLSVQQGTSGPVLGATGVFQGGTRTLHLTLKPGTYTYFCSVPGHRQSGMQGTLTVVS